MKISHRPVNRRSALSRLLAATSTPQKISAVAGIFLLLTIVFIGGALVMQRTRTASQPAADHSTTQLQVVDVTMPADMPKPTSQLDGMKFYVNPASNAAKQSKAWANEASKFDKLAKLPSALWVTSREGINVVAPHILAAEKEGSVPILVSYNFHERDCGGYSAGGASSSDDYKTYVNELASAIGNSKVIVIIEPDAIAQTNHNQACAQGGDHNARYELLAFAVSELGKLPNTFTYLDAGNSRWVNDIDDLANRLRNSGVEKADGFSLNVSNFVPTDETIGYGQKIAAKLGNKHFVIDTSRNGLGTFTNAAVPTHTWCNPPGRALGHYPTTNTGHELVDAFLYIKYPGESDGTDPDYNKCFGGPKAGDWWPEYALGLIERWPKDLQP